jgi:ATP-dependent phosphofructokinase / diphosphate-dependent phosphofructokinase
MKTIGMLTGGGDCPGLNAVIRAVTRRALMDDFTVLGFRNGWAGAIRGDYVPLSRERISGILHQGGTILGTSRTNPTEEQLEKIAKNVKGLDLTALIAIGGDDTLTVASRLHKRGIPVIGVPKTIDNDIDGTDQTFGFDTAVNIATEALDRLHTTAEAHSRVLVVEIMGRHAGWIALAAGIAGGADLVLIPEFPMSLDAVCEVIKRRQAGGKNFSIIAVAEGFILEGREVTQVRELDAFGHVRLGGIGEVLCKEIEARSKIESRAVVLGHIQRGGTPTAYDRVLSTRYGIKAVELALAGQFGKMVALRGTDVVAVDFDSVIVEVTDPKTGQSKLRLRNRLVTKELYDVAKVFFG